MELITQEELKSKLYTTYNTIYDSINFDTQSNITDILPVRDIIKQSNIGDYIFNIGITGDTSYTLESSFYRSEITLVYGISKRFNIYDDINKDCIEGSTTRMILFDSVSFFGLGDSIDNSRYNAFLESRNKISNNITSSTDAILNTILES